MAFRRGKRPSKAVIEFESELLENILALANSLQAGTYHHGLYSHMIVNDNKRRDIAVASVRDRVIHRLLYDYLVPIWDKTFIYDAWSCRKNKGLHGAIERAQSFMRRYPNVWLWRGDITKLFESVDKKTLKRLLRRRINDPTALWLLDEIIDSYSSFENDRGIPIGNLTSQILANIYLNEFDRFIKHQLRIRAYLRYGDDWLCFADKEQMLRIRERAIGFLKRELGLSVNPKIDFIEPVYKGVSYLGVDLWPSGRRVEAKTRLKIRANLNLHNITGYKSLMSHHQSEKYIKRFEWLVLDILDTI